MKVRTLAAFVVLAVSVQIAGAQQLPAPNFRGLQLNGTPFFDANGRMVSSFFPGLGGGDITCPAGSVVCTANGKLSHVANAAALATWTNYAFPVHRDDVGVDYIDSGTDCPAADRGAQVQGLSGHCFYAQLVAQTSVSMALWGVVADSNGTTGNGTDNTAGVKASVAWSVATGREVDIPGGSQSKFVRVTAPISLAGRANIGGVGCGPYIAGQAIPNPGPGSWLYEDQTGQGIVANASGYVLHDFCMIWNQPAPPAGSDGTGAGAPWMANANDYAIVQNNDDGRLDNLVLLNPTLGIKVNGGRIVVRNVRGQFLQRIIYVDGSLDSDRVEDSHDWPFWSQNTAVFNYQYLNKEAIYTARADAFRVFQLYSLPGKTCWHIGTNAGGDTSYDAAAYDLGCDSYANRGILIDGSPNKPADVTLTKFGFGGGGVNGGTVSSGPGIDIQNGSLVIAYAPNVTNTQTAAYNAGGSNARMNLIAPSANAWGKSGAGGIGAFNAGAAAYLNISSLSSLLNPPSDVAVYSGAGNILQDGVDPRLVNKAYTPTVSAASGTITTASATGSFTKRGNQVVGTATITVTTNGSGATALNFTLPYAPAVMTYAFGANNGTKAVVVGAIGAGNSTVSVNTTTNGYPAADGTSFTIPFSYQAAQ